MKVPPTPPNEPARLAALRAYCVLDTPPETAFDDLVAMAAHICEAPIALISLVDENRQWFKAALGFDKKQTDRTLSFCAHAIHGTATFVVADALTDVRFADHPLVTSEPHIRFYAGCPLLTPEGHALGTLCVIDHTARQLRPDHERALRILSRHVMALLELRRQSLELALVREQLDGERRKREEALRRDVGELELRIAERTAARQEAEAERDRMFNLSPDLFCIADFHGHFKQLNPAWERTLGHSLHDLMTKPFVDFVHPDDRERTIAEHQRVLQGRPSEKFENRYRCRDGSWKWLSWNVIALTEEGLAYAVARDVTIEKEVAAALAESEERYRSLVESARDAILTLSPERVIMSANAAFEAITGWHRDARVGEPFDSIVHAEDLPLALSIIEQVLRGDAPATAQLRLLTHSGDRAPLEMTFTPLRIRGELAGALGIGRDIRERLHLEDQVRRIQKLDSIGRFAAGIAHDFNNVLTVQQSMVSMLLTDPQLPPSVAQDLREVSRACERAAALTRQLLLFSRNQVMQVRPLNLNEVVEGLSHMLRRLLGADVDLVCHPGRGLPPVQADAGMVEQVLMNLAANARDAMPNGGRLTIATAPAHVDREATQVNPEARAGTFVRVTVSDTGTGIAADVLEHMFEPFFTTKGVGDGTGLGLATVHGIVKQHGGWIEVDAPSGAGATFHLFFPATASTAASVEGRGPAPGLRGGDETVLVAEDEPAVRRIVQRILERFGYRVLVASSGVDALRVSAEHSGPIHLLLTDMVMPHGVGGRELAERLRAERPGIKVLFASGYSSEAVGLRTALGDRFAFLPKPYALAPLVQAVRACLDARA
jgi:PAS domain S-box-containing protein